LVFEQVNLPIGFCTARLTSPPPHDGGSRRALDPNKPLGTRWFFLYFSIVGRPEIPSRSPLHTSTRPLGHPAGILRVCRRAPRVASFCNCAAFTASKRAVFLAAIPLVFPGACSRVSPAFAAACARSCHILSALPSNVGSVHRPTWTCSLFPLETALRFGLLPRSPWHGARLPSLSPGPSECITSISSIFSWKYSSSVWLLRWISPASLMAATFFCQARF